MKTTVYLDQYIKKVYWLCTAVCMIISVIWGTSFGGTAWILLLPASLLFGLLAASILMSIAYIVFTLTSVGSNTKYNLGDAAVMVPYALCAIIVFAVFKFSGAAMEQSILGAAVIGGVPILLAWEDVKGVARQIL